MTHEDAGKYGAKHPAGTILDSTIAAALQQAVEDGRVTCTAAHMIARDLEFTPAEVGTTTDLLEYRIIECQLGLFGYTPQKRIVKAAGSVSDGLRGLLLAAVDDDERIDCASCWKIARTLGLEKMEVSAACERLGLKVRRCQLGAF